MVLKEEMQRLTQQLVGSRSLPIVLRMSVMLASQSKYRTDNILCVQLAYEGEGRVIATEPSSKQIRELHKVEPPSYPSVTAPPMCHRCPAPAAQSDMCVYWSGKWVA